MVSGTRKKTPRRPVPASAVCSQKMERHEEYVTITPPRNGPNAGPIRVPERNQPIAVPRSVGRYISLSAVSTWQEANRTRSPYPIDAAPNRINAVPSNADSARKTKKEAKFGANAVARLSKKNRTAVKRRTCTARFVSLPTAALL